MYFSDKERTLWIPRHDSLEANYIAYNTTESQQEAKQEHREAYLHMEIAASNLPVFFLQGE